MTLYRQIALLMSALLLLLSAAIAWSNFQQASRFFQGQMQATADDMATNLGITIAHTVEGYDKARLETLFNTVFDSGYFSRIELRTPEGKPVVAKEQPVTISGVPQWFVEAVPLQPAVGHTEIVKGWSPYGSLSMTLHPGYVYGQLYQTLSSMLLWFVLLFLGGLAALAVLLRWVLRPLVAVEMQAEALQENRFVRQEPLPRTPELRRVAAAMNRMVDKMQGIFADQAALLSRYHDLLFRDPVTGIANRAHFVARMEELSRDESASGGSLLIIQFRRLLELNRRHGFEFTNTLLRGLADLITDRLQRQTGGFAARLNATDFVVYLPEPTDTARDFASDIYDRFRPMLRAHDCDTEAWLSAGVVGALEKQAVGQLLARADFALTQARAQESYATVEAATDAAPRGKQEWRAWLSQMAEEHRFFLVAQPVFNADDTLFHRELLLRLRDENGTIHAAGSFMPMVSSLGMGPAIDREVYRLALAASERAPALALNLPGSVLTSADSLAEFERFLRQFRAASATTLFVEVPHFSLVTNRRIAHHITELLRQNHCSFGIDHFDLGGDLGILQATPPAYIKIDARKLAHLARDSAAFQPLQTIARGLDSRLVAVGIDSAELLTELRQIKGLSCQGNLLAPPEEFR